ncbi:MAG TPA: hypothetical protein DD733_08875 [Clostridiales bacterium]|nr:hypothetical protein [Clostridiales bacterium]
MSFFGGSRFVAIVQMIANKHKSKIDVTEHYIKTAMDFEKLSTERYFGINKRLLNAENTLAEAKSEIIMYKKCIDLLEIF